MLRPESGQPEAQSPGVRGLPAAAAGGPFSWRLEHYESLPSTSDLCAARARAGEPAGLAVLAARQTAGRGSRGRQWQAPPGNLNLSALIRPARRLAEAGWFALLAGLATAEALAALLPPSVPLLLKWPNDVLAGGAKIAGVLIDTAAGADRLDWLVFGIGVNLVAAPRLPGRATTALNDHGGHADAGTVAAAVLDRLAAWLGRLDAEGAAPLCTAWLARAHPLGTALEVATGGGTMRGEFAGISPHGELLLARDREILRVNTGEVLLGGAAAGLATA